MAILKIIVEPEAHQIRGQTVICGSDREAAIGEIEIKPFGFGRPVLREAYLGAETRGPAQTGVALDGDPEVVPVSSP